MFIARPSYVSVLMLLAFFTTGQWPIHRRLQRAQHVGRNSTSLIAVSITYGDNFSRRGLQLLQKCKFFHFPDIDSSTVASDFIFDTIFVNRYVLYANWQLILPTLLELEGVFEGQIGLAQRCAKSIFFRCYFRVPHKQSPYFLQTAIRALQLPFVASARFFTALSNSGIDFVKQSE